LFDTYIQDLIAEVGMGLISNLTGHCDKRQGYGLNDLCSIPGKGNNVNFLFIIVFRPALGPSQPLIQRVPGGSYPEGKADHSPPSNAEVNSAWSYTSTPPICLHGVVLS